MLLATVMLAEAATMLQTVLGSQTQNEADLVCIVLILSSISFNGHRSDLFYFYTYQGSAPRTRSEDTDSISAQIRQESPQHTQNDDAVTQSRQTSPQLMRTGDTDPNLIRASIHSGENFYKEVRVCARSSVQNSLLIMARLCSKYIRRPRAFWV